MRLPGERGGKTMPHGPPEIGTSQLVTEEPHPLDRY